MKTPAGRRTRDERSPGAFGNPSRGLALLTGGQSWMPNDAGHPPARAAQVPRVRANKTPGASSEVEALRSTASTQVAIMRHGGAPCRPRPPPRSRPDRWGVTVAAQATSFGDLPVAIVQGNRQALLRGADCASSAFASLRRSASTLRDLGHRLGLGTNDGTGHHGHEDGPGAPQRPPQWPAPSRGPGCRAGLPAPMPRAGGR